MRKFKFEFIQEEENDRKKVEIYENDFYTLKKTYYKDDDYTLFRVENKDPSLPELVIKEENLKAVDVGINLEVSNPVPVKYMLKVIENVNIALISANKIKKLF